MVDVKFRYRGDPTVLAFTDSRSLDTIFIPTEVMDNVLIFLHDEFGLSFEQAEKAAPIFLEEIYDHALAHEATHLALGHLAKKERLPIAATMEGLHNIAEDFDMKHMATAVSKALHALRRRR